MFISETKIMKCLCNAIAIIVAISLFSRDVLSEQVPVIKAFEVDEFNTVINPYERVDKKLSEIIADKLANIRLECHADYPVQWIYTGNGVGRSGVCIFIGCFIVKLFRFFSESKGPHKQHGYLIFYLIVNDRKTK